MKLKIYQRTYEALDKLVRCDADYELVFDGIIDTVDLADVFRSFNGRMPPYMYFGRSLGEGDVICVFGGRWHGVWMCEATTPESCLSAEWSLTKSRRRIR